MKLKISILLFLIIILSNYSCCFADVIGPFDVVEEMGESILFTVCIGIGVIALSMISIVILNDYYKKKNTNASNWDKVMNNLNKKQHNTIEFLESVIYFFAIICALLMLIMISEESNILSFFLFIFIVISIVLRMLKKHKLSYILHGITVSIILLLFFIFFF